MRISYLAATTLAICFLPLSTPAFAGCNSTSCAPVGQTITYGSTYGSGYGSGAYANQGISTRYGMGNTAACPSGSIRARDGFCMTNGSTSFASSSASTSYASSSTFGSSSHSAGQVVPFTTTVGNISKYRVAGMGENEFLTPTKCPVNVYNPDGHKVLGCYSVVKPVQTVRPVKTVQTVRRVQQIRYQQVRVVQPIIYVRYPVFVPVPMIMPRPIPVPMPRPVFVPVCRTQTVCNSGCNSNTSYSRYGNAWPRVRNNCSRWN